MLLMFDPEVVGLEPVEGADGDVGAVPPSCCRRSSSISTFRFAGFGVPLGSSDDEGVRILFSYVPVLMLWLMAGSVELVVLSPLPAYYLYIQDRSASGEPPFTRNVVSSFVMLILIVSASFPLVPMSVVSSFFKASVIFFSSSVCNSSFSSCYSASFFKSMTPSFSDNGGSNGL